MKGGCYANEEAQLQVRIQQSGKNIKKTASYEKEHLEIFV
jgi:hypothetical protein